LSHGWLVVLLVALCGWAVALVVGTLVIRKRFGELGRLGAWPRIRTLVPTVDLIGAWCGTVAAIALLVGRQGGFRLPWAGALLLVAMMVAAGLYHRAVLVPSLEAAWKRLEHGAPDPKFEQDWAFLWRMSAWTHLASLVGVIGAIGCSVFA